MIGSIYKKKHKLLALIILVGSGLVLLASLGFRVELEYLFLTIIVFIIALILAFYDLIYQKQIEINQIDKYIEVYFPIIRKKNKLMFDEIIKVEVIKNISEEDGGCRDDLIIISRSHRLKFSSSHMEYFDSLVNKLKYELKSKVSVKVL